MRTELTFMMAHGNILHRDDSEINHNLIEIMYVVENGGVLGGVPGTGS